MGAGPSWPRMSASSRSNFDVVIAGFGPVGAVCANLLGQAGIKTLVVERAEAVYDKPRAFALDHEIMRVFQNLGLAAAIAPHTAPFTPSEYYGVEGQLIKRLGSLPPPWPLGWPPSMVFSQPPVEEALRAKARAHPSVEVLLGCEFIDLEQKAEEIAVKIRDDRGKQKEIFTRYLVGCDGASSTVRR